MKQKISKKKLIGILMSYNKIRINVKIAEHTNLETVRKLYLSTPPLFCSLAAVCSKVVIDL